MRYYTIGELSRLCGVPTSTLRFYAKHNVFLPIYRDESNGYQYYSSEQVKTLNALTLLREINVPIKEINDFLAHPRNAADVNLFLQGHRRRLLEQITKLERAVEKIDEITHAYSSLALDDPELGKPFLRHYPHRRVIYKQAKILVEDSNEWALYLVGSEMSDPPIQPEERPKALMSIGVYCPLHEVVIEGTKSYSGGFIESCAERKNRKEHCWEYKNATFLAVRFEDTVDARRDAYRALMDYIEKEHLKVEDRLLELITDAWFPQVWQNPQILEFQVRVIE